MSGFTIHFNPQFFSERKRYSLVLLWNLWTLGLQGAFRGTDVTEIVFKPDDWAVMTVHRYHGSGWIWLPVLPFIMLHESLHLIIAYFTPWEIPVRYIPPVLDLFWLPVAFSIAFIHPTVLSLLVGDWICLGWFRLLMGNLRGDFARAKREKPQDSKP
jgi:hypothetical protein